MNLENPGFLLIDYISHTYSVGSLEFSLHVRSALSLSPPKTVQKYAKRIERPTVIRKGKKTSFG
jgi:hypothetical protein